MLRLHLNISKRIPPQSLTKVFEKVVVVDKSFQVEVFQFDRRFQIEIIECAWGSSGETYKYLTSISSLSEFLPHSQ